MRHRSQPKAERHVDDAMRARLQRDLRAPFLELRIDMLVAQRVARRRGHILATIMRITLALILAIILAVDARMRTA